MKHRLPEDQEGHDTDQEDAQWTACDGSLMRRAACRLDRNATLESHCRLQLVGLLTPHTLATVPRDAFC